MIEQHGRQRSRARRRADPAPFRPIPVPSIDDVRTEDLYRLEEHEVDTEDGWRLALVRYRPRSQPFPQPLYGVPLLLVQGIYPRARFFFSDEAEGARMRAPAYGTADDTYTWGSA